MFNMMNNPFSSPMAGGMPQIMSAAPQIPVRQSPQGGGMQMPTPAPQSGQQPQQKGFFGNMMSSPQQMQAGMNLGDKAYNGISGMFGGANPAINPAGAPFSASMAGPPMPALDMGANAAANTGMFSAMAPSAIASAAPAAAVSAIPAAAGAAGVAGAAGTAAAASAMPEWLTALLFL